MRPECSLHVFLKRRNSAEMASDALWIVSFKCVVKGYQDCRFEFTNRGTTQGTREFNQLSFLPQEQCFVILKQNTLLKVQGKTTLDNHKIDVHDVHDHPIIYFDFDRRRKIILLLHLSAHIVKIFIFLSDSVSHPMNFCKRKI